MIKVYDSGGFVSVSYRTWINVGSYSSSVPQKNTPGGGKRFALARRKSWDRTQAWS